MTKATDKRPGFFMVEDAIVENYKLNPYEGWLYIVIVKYANRKTGEAFPGIGTLAKYTGMSRASVIRYTKSLEEKGLLQVDRAEYVEGKGREPNHYWLLQATQVVSHSNHPSVSEQSPLVADVDLNQSQFEPDLDNHIGEAPEIGIVSKSNKQTLDELYNVIAKVWETDAGGWIGNLRGMLTGKGKRGEWKDCQLSPGATADEIAAFGAWCKANDNLRGKVPTQPTTIQKYFYQYRADVEARNKRPKYQIIPYDTAPTASPVPDDVAAEMAAIMAAHKAKISDFYYEETDNGNQTSAA